MLGVATSTAVIDVGGGASVLVDALVGLGFNDITVLDVSATALDAAQQRLGDSVAVNWLQDDVLSWRPERRYGLWHDRAVLHFLIEEEDRKTYLNALRRAIEPGGAVVLGTFASDGPEYCSGLPVVRYSTGALSKALGTDFEVVATRKEVHTTPANATQSFTWVAARSIPTA